MSLRYRDHKTEENIGRYLDKYFYPELLKQTRINEVVRITTLEEQRSGIDIKLITKTEEYLVDEKVSSNYNKKLDKFALELSSIQNGKEIEGWLTSDKFINDLYLFGWMDVIDDLIKGAMINNFQVIEENQILSIDVMIVSKAKIIEYFNSLGYTKKYFQLLNTEVRKGNIKLENGKFIRKKDYDNNKIDFHFTFSQRKKEKPFMINLRRSLIEQLSYYSYEVSSEVCTKRK